MAAETKNGGTSPSNCKDHSRRKLLVGVDLFCLFLGKTELDPFHLFAVLGGTLTVSNRKVVRPVLGLPPHERCPVVVDDFHLISESIL